MAQLDEIDLEILELLIEDARRPYSEIAGIVGLSPPAVSDRVSRLAEAGVIQRFTLDVDRSQLQDGVSVLVEVDPPPAAVNEVADSLRMADAVEHVFTTASAGVVAVAHLQSESVREWLAETVDDSLFDDYEVTLLSETAWTPALGGASFGLSCAECGNTVTDEGVSRRIDGSLHHFCCPSCESQFAKRYEQLKAGVDGD